MFFWRKICARKRAFVRNPKVSNVAVNHTTVVQQIGEICWIGGGSHWRTEALDTRKQNRRQQHMRPKKASLEWLLLKCNRVDFTQSLEFKKLTEESWT